MTFDESDIDGFYLDDGTKLDPNLVPTPGLCLSCSKDDDPEEYVLCMLNRMDQMEDEEFICHSYQQKTFS